MRRTLEVLQDVVATLLMLLLLVLSLRALWRLAQMAIDGLAATTELLSDIIFVLILMELYRLMIYYLREHRISVALMVEVALVSILREVMLKGAYGFRMASARGAQSVAGRPRRAPGHGGAGSGAGGTRRPKSMPADHPAILPDRIDVRASDPGLSVPSRATPPEPTFGGDDTGRVEVGEYRPEPERLTGAVLESLASHIAVLDESDDPGRQ